MGDLRKMLDPKTVAFIGADDREGSRGRSILDNLLLSAGRKVFPVNPDRDRVLGLDCRPSISDIDEHIDLAVISVADELILPVTGECAERGVEGAIIISAGPRNDMGERKELEKKALGIRKKFGMRLIGPGSSGIIMPNDGLNATFLKAAPVQGSTAFISQSGTMGGAMFYWGVDNRIGFSMFASLGSMIDVDFADLIDFLQEDYFTKNIMLYMEHVKDAKKFLSASRCFARNKPIVVLKPGRYPQSTEALFSHTAHETGSDMVYDAAFRRVGMVRAKETEDFFDTARILVSRALPRGPRLAVVSNSGGLGVIACDILVEQKGQLARFTEKSTKKLEGITKGSRNRNNPFDLSGEAVIEEYLEAVDICLRDDGVDGVLVVYAPSSHCDPGELAREMATVAMKVSKTLVAVWMGGQYSREGITVLRESGIPAYETPEDAVRAYMYMVDYRRNIALLNETPEELPEGEMKLTNHLKAIVRNAAKEHQETIAGKEAYGFLKNYGIPVYKEPVSGEETAASGHPVDEWALRSMKDVDFGTVILLISMNAAHTRRTGFAVGLPPLNQVLARRLMDDAGFHSDSGPVMRRMEELLVRFSNLIADFPEVSEIEIEAVVMPDEGVYAKETSIRVDSGYQKGIGQYPHLSIMPYPSRYIRQWKMRDGRDVLLRPVRAEDAPMVKEMMSTLSEETLRLRFFVIMEIDHRMLMNFCNTDYDREIAIAVELREGDKKRIIGGGRIIVEPDTGNGQFALLVSDDFQKQGLGEKLLDTVIGIAQDKGLREIYGIVLSENTKMLGLSRKMGFKPTVLPDGITRVSLELD